MAVPHKGTVLRAAYDAAHIRWCGSDCFQSCETFERESWDEQEMRAVIAAVRKYDMEKRIEVLDRALAREQRSLGL